MPDTFGYPQQTPQSPSTGLFHDRERPIRRPLAHRLDEFPAGYSSADCSPAGSASASPTVDHFALMSSRRSILFCRTVNSVLTVCLSSGDQPTMPRKPKHIKGQGSLFQDERSPYWQLSYWNGWRQVRESSKTKNKEQP